MDNKESFSYDEYADYLQMIQDVINRMSTNSALFKGFTATIVAGAILALFTDLSLWAAVVALLPIMCFLGLDLYYLQLEKRYRYLFNQVRKGLNNEAFLMEPPPLKETDVTLSQCFKSISIMGFYLPQIITLIILIIILRCNV